MKTISFLLGSALATVCFLLFTSFANFGERGSSPPVSWSHQDGAHKKGSNDIIAIKAVREDSKQEVKGKKIVYSEGSKNKTKLQAAPLTEEVKGKIELPSSHLETQSQDLADILKRAATADNTVLMTSINEAWAAPNSFLDLFLQSFREGEHIEHLVKHLVIVSVDQKAFDRCKALHAFCYFLKVDGMDFAAEQSYMKGDYLEMMWRRNRFQQSILELGYSFLFTDVDILWFRNPFPHISPEAQLVMSADFFVGDTNSMANYPNGGLLYVKSCKNTIEFYKHWQMSRERFPGKHEQYVFDKIIKEGLPVHLETRIQFLDTNYFGGFCQHGKDLSKVCTMHANCCVGLENKLFDLKNVLEDWKNYKARIMMGSMDYFSWRIPGRCIH